MRYRRVSINCCCRLGTSVTICGTEIKCGNAMLAKGAFECGAATHRFDGVIPHASIVVLLPGPTSGAIVWTPERPKAREVTRLIQIRRNSVSKATHIPLPFREGGLGIAEISKANRLYLEGGKKVVVAAEQERRFQRLQEILDELMSLTDWKKA